MKARHVLGVSAFYHDSAAALVSDGRIFAAAHEERFTRKKHDPRFPVHAINYCLEEAELEPRDLAAAVFYENPALTMDRIVHATIDAGERGLVPWLDGAPGQLGTKLHFAELLRRELGHDVPVLFAEHHQSHAASAFYPSPFERAAILTIDGVGEWATTTLATGGPEGIRVLKEIHFPHSLGLLYSAVTQYCGFKVNSGEYKLMGLAPYGRPRYAELIESRLIDVREDGSFRLDMGYFAYTHSLRMTDERLHALFGGPPREPESRITRRDCDLAASIQLVLERVVLKIARHLRELTDLENICMAGGVALNCVATGKLLREGTFRGLWVQPAAGDAGGALGAAFLATHGYFGDPRPAPSADRDSQLGSFLGPGYSNAEVRAFLDLHGYPYEVVADDERARRVARHLADGKIVGYMVGRAEFGPRALGARSILGDPRNPETQSAMNLKIKFRESFRPFAPSVLRERCAEWFELDVESPYMLLVAPVREELRLPFELDESAEDLIPILNHQRSRVPAITHVDYSARVQTVDCGTKPDYHSVITEFEKLTGVPMVVNTSFNVRGEPMVLTPREAYLCFMRTEIDVLVLENCVLLKPDQPPLADDAEWRKEYELD
jgi:carbamoyltransferase